MRERFWLFTLLVILCACPLQAADDHHHLYGNPEKLGTVSFTISCSPAVQQRFERGVALMHSFWYDEAERHHSDRPELAHAKSSLSGALTD